ncbi:MAG: recombinase family protein [Clostridia bacterium]|nr:recombinase family protein [Clostridia bacterium]
MNAVIYARYSSDSQREESIDGQLRECKAYCEKHDITIVGTYIDRALSAKTDDRPDFRKMIKDSEKKQFELVVVWKLDRFSRNRADSAKYKTILGINGVKVVSATENISTGAEGILLESVLEGLAEYYSADLSEKVKRGQTENALKCKFNGGTIPLGYMVSDDQHLVINPAEAPLVKEIFHRFNNGESMSDIAEDFKRRGIKNRNGRNFYVNTIGNVLRNRRNIGEYRYRDIVVPKGIPSIIDDDEFENAQKRLAQYRHAPAKGKATEEYLLSTKLFCGTCKRMMVGESGKSRNGTVHYYYKCRGNKKYKDCDRKAVKKHWIEDLVVEQTRKNILENTRVIEKIADDIISIQEKENALLPALKAQLEDCDKKISNLIRAVEDGLYNEHTKARMDELDQQRTKLLLNIAEEEIKMPKYTRDDILAWIRQFQRGNPKSFRYKKRLIDLFVNAVYIYDDRIVFVYNYKSGTDTVMLKDIEAVLGSDFQNVSPPEKKAYSSVSLFSTKCA